MDARDTTIQSNILDNKYNAPNPIATGATIGENVAIAIPICPAVGIAAAELNVVNAGPIVVAVAKVALPPTIAPAASWVSFSSKSSSFMA